MVLATFATVRTIELPPEHEHEVQVGHSSLAILALAARGDDGVRPAMVTSHVTHLAQIPCGPLYLSHTFPDKELAVVIAERRK